MLGRPSQVVGQLGQWLVGSCPALCDQRAFVSLLCAQYPVFPPQTPPLPLLLPPWSQPRALPGLRASVLPFPSTEICSRDSPLVQAHSPSCRHLEPLNPPGHSAPSAPAYHWPRLFFLSHWSLWNSSSLTRDQTWALSDESRVPTTGTPGN